MRVTAEEHPRRIGRFSHIPRAPRWRATVCEKRCPGADHTCTRTAGHSGPHASHGRFGRVVAVWDTGAPLRSSPELTVRSGTREGRKLSGGPTWIRHRRWRPAGLFHGLWSRIRTLLASPEELFLLILLIAFSIFALRWLLIILR